MLLFLWGSLQNHLCMLLYVLFISSTVYINSVSCALKFFITSLMMMVWVPPEGDEKLTEFAVVAADWIKQLMEHYYREHDVEH